MDESTASTLLPLMATGAAMTVASLAALQTDYVSRKFLLSPTRLHVKRASSYSYRWKQQIIEYTRLQLSYFLAGGVSDLNDNPKLLDKNYTEYISSKNLDAMKQLIENILDKKSKTTYRIIKIDQDSDDPSNEFYLYLMEEQQQEDDDNTKPNRYYDPTKLLLYQVPLIDFCAMLKEELDNQITTTTLCFVADASSNKCYDFIYGLCDTISEKYPIGIVKEPFWLATIATLMEEGLLEPQV